MRTTLRLDDDVYSAAQSLAKLEGKSLGGVVSELVRKALAPSARRPRHGRGAFPMFDVPKGAAPISSEMVKRALG